jgi:hypothetical protein
MKAMRPPYFDLRAKRKELGDVGTDVIMLSDNFWPRTLHRFVHPSRGFPSQLFVKGTEEAHHLDGIERRFPIEVNGLELVEEPFYQRLQAARIPVEENVLYVPVSNSDPTSRSKKCGTSKKDVQIMSVSVLMLSRNILGMNVSNQSQRLF